MHVNEEGLEKKYTVKNNDVYCLSSRKFYDHIALTVQDTVLENCN